MRVTRHTSLLLGPAHGGRCPGRPPFQLAALRAGIGLVLQVQQADMAERLRAETADLDIVFEHSERFAELVGGRFEELALEFIARPPGEIAADVQALALYMQKHILSE